MTRTLVLGGTRSGKSLHAETVAVASGKRLIYLATARALDSEMSERIAMHRARRSIGKFAETGGQTVEQTGGPSWLTVEEPLALGDAIRTHADADSILLIDCLTVWLSNLLFSDARLYPDVGKIDPPPLFAEQKEDLMQALAAVRGDVVLVSNEVGMGIVPQGAVTRWFMDEAGRLNQEVAALCERVVFVAAGLPLVLKQ